MSSFSRAVPAALAVVVLALTLGLATTLWTSSDAEAASQPSPVGAASMVDADSCTTFTYGYFNPFGNAYGYYPYYAGYAAPMAFQCVSPAFCVGVSSYYFYQPYSLVCPGPPATMEVNQASATCASATNIQVKVRDANGLNVLDGTSVSFSVTPFGMVTSTVETNGGEATASLTTPTKTSGTLTLTVTAGSVTRTMNIDVSCSAPGSVAYGSGGATSSGSGATSSSQPTVIYVMPGSTGY